MIALISPAKTMKSNAITPIADYSEPRFAENAQHIVSLMLRYSAFELAEIFKVSAPIAQELMYRFSNFIDSETDRIAAIDSYDGVVYKHFKEQKAFSREELEYLQTHIRISSLLYGLLRPLDLIKPYRMEGFVRLAGSDERVDRYWRDIQTQTLIEDVKQAGGALLYLASKEEQNAFHWREVKKSVNVIEIQFLVNKGDKLRQVVVYTKMARGEMLRYMIDNKIENSEDIKTFSWNGYHYNESLSTENVWVWLMN